MPIVTNMSKETDARSRGFTLIEMVIVLAILGILAAVAAPRFITSQRRFQVRTAAARVAADLMQVRSVAQTSGVPQTVTFDVEQNAYSLPNANDSQQLLQVDLDDSPYPAKVIEADFGDSQTVTFDIFGRPSSGGKVTLYLVGETQVVFLDGESGQTFTSDIDETP